MTIAFTDLFTRIGKISYACEQMFAALSTQETITQALLDAFDSESIQVKRSIDSLISRYESNQGRVASMVTSLFSSPARQLLINTVAADVGISLSLEQSLTELIDQMVAESESVESSTVSVTVTAGGSNVGDAKGIASVLRSDGLTTMFALDEDIVAEVIAVSEAGPTWRLRSPERRGLMDYRYPGGSGLNFQMGQISPASQNNLLPSSAFTEVETNDASCPKGWIATDANATGSLTSIEQQSFAITGTPTSGWFSVTVVDSQSRSYTTAPLAVGATDADVQAAIRALPGFELVTVSTSGTTPNLTYTLTFTGVASPGIVDVVSDFDTGSAGSETTIVGSGEVTTDVYRSLLITGDGSEQTTYHVPVSMSGGTQYVFHSRLKKDTVSSGVFAVTLKDGVNGTTLQDESGNSCTGQVTISSIGSGWYHFSVVMQTPLKMPPQAYLQLKCSTAINSGGKLYIAGAFLGVLPSMYAGGPKLAIFAGATAPAIGDTITFAVNNNYSGKLHSWANRLLSLESLGLQLPVSGSPTQADALVG